MAVALFKVLPWYLPGGTKKNHKNLSQDSCSPFRDLNPRPTKYKIEVLPILTQLLPMNCTNY
jgi:hypothetical protein